MRKNLENGVFHAMNAFIRVVHSGSFTAAAAQLDVTTPQISRLVTELESRLQTKLLQRTTRKLVLTSAGEKYFKQAELIMELLAEAEQMAAGAAAQPAGRLRVLCMASFGNRYVVPLVTKYSARHPLVSIEYSTSQYMPDLLSEGIDVSVYLSQHLPDSGLIAQRLGTISAVLCASPKYLATHGVPEHPRDLVNHACLRLVNPSLTTHWKLINGNESFTIDPVGPIIGDLPEPVVHAAIHGLGIALLMSHNIVDALRRGTLVHVLPQWKSPEIGIYLLFPSRKFVDAKTREWAELLKTEIPILLEKDAEHMSQVMQSNGTSTQ
ncbi:LysR family transcriptional regulator [Paraburkholderia sp. Ac-20336]|uniref:LysR family transcriptional regulator n=1 Tax=Paraburkholderia sp. Ac-20336 TaxID=2703886 RepID=UPI00197F5D6A|nr:LysR family transcriptional regulator [Paraburkholderia sp. Ac-20336]MBN3804077.1 LysR family transcriptional regulator [Paraburkholderia sp. Ac-20336]